MICYLSPSTQESNIGAGNYGTEEKRMNQITDITEKILKQHGIIVYRNNPTWNLHQVCEDSNNKKSNIHFAIHSNANDGKCRGCEIYCHKLGGEGERLAKSVYKYIAPITPTEDRGIKQGYNFYGIGKHMYELCNTNAWASLIEIAFHDNKDDAAWIVNNIEYIGIAIARGILDYFGVAYKNVNVNNNNAVMAGINILYNKKLINDKVYWSNKATKDVDINQLFINASKFL